MAKQLIEIEARFRGQSYFGVKDSLQPIDQYTEEIKSSSDYKEYLFGTERQLIRDWLDNNIIQEYLNISWDAVESSECIRVVLSGVTFDYVLNNESILIDINEVKAS